MDKQKDKQIRRSRRRTGLPGDRAELYRRGEMARDNVRVERRGLARRNVLVHGHHQRAADHDGDKQDESCGGSFGRKPFLPRSTQATRLVSSVLKWSPTRC